MPGILRAFGRFSTAILVYPRHYRTMPRGVSVVDTVGCTWVVLAARPASAALASALLAASCAVACSAEVKASARTRLSSSSVLRLPASAACSSFQTQPAQISPQAHHVSMVCRLPGDKPKCPATAKNPHSPQLLLGLAPAGLGPLQQLPDSTGTDAFL